MGGTLHFDYDEEPGCARRDEATPLGRRSQKVGGPANISSSD